MPTKPGHGLRAVGVVWYRKADWPRLRALLADADELPDTLRGMARLRRGAPGAAEAGRHRRREGAARPRRVLRLVRRARLGARCPGQVAVRQRGRRRRAPAPALSGAWLVAA